LDIAALAQEGTRNIASHHCRTPVAAASASALCRRDEHPAALGEFPCCDYHHNACWT
jgi:hypothetical protein